MESTLVQIHQKSKKKLKFTKNFTLMTMIDVDKILKFDTHTYIYTRLIYRFFDSTGKRAHDIRLHNFITLRFVFCKIVYAAMPQTRRPYWLIWLLYVSYVYCVYSSDLYIYYYFMGTPSSGNPSSVKKKKTCSNDVALYYNIQ